jgi:hypothetical protein
MSLGLLKPQRRPIEGRSQLQRAAVLPSLDRDVGVGVLQQK